MFSKLKVRVRSEKNFPVARDESGLLGEAVWMLARRVGFWRYSSGLWGLQGSPGVGHRHGNPSLASGPRAWCRATWQGSYAEQGQRLCGPRGSQRTARAQETAEREEGYGLQPMFWASWEGGMAGSPLVGVRESGGAGSQAFLLDKSGFESFSSSTLGKSNNFDKFVSPSVKWG